MELLVDGELIGEDRAEAYWHVEGCAECQRVLEMLEAESRLIRATRPRITVPESLRSAILKQMGKTNPGEQESPEQAKTPALGSSSSQMVTMYSRRWGRAGMAFAATLLIAGGIFSYNYGYLSNANALVEEALLIHQAVQSNAMPLDISSNSPAKVIDYFHHKISFPLQYANAGIASDDFAKYKLTGGRVISVGNERGVVLSFALGNEPITMIVSSSNIATPTCGREFHAEGITFHSQDRDSLHVVTWRNRGLSYALTSTRGMTNSGKCTTCHEGRSPTGQLPDSAPTMSVGELPQS
jgi:anti-sigma factor RsiW